MIKTILTIVLTLLFGLGGYLVVFTKSAGQADELCSGLAEGKTLGEASEIESRYGVVMKGPFEDKQRPGVLTSIFCSDLELCDTSCVVDTRDGEIVRFVLFQ